MEYTSAWPLLVLVVAFSPLVLLLAIVMGALWEPPAWVPGAQYRDLALLYERSQRSAAVGVEVARAATNALESYTPDYQDRRYLTSLRLRMGRALSEDDLQTLCFDLSVDYDDLPASTFTGKVRELLNALSRQNRVSELVAILTRERPDIDWLKAGDA